MIFKRLFFASVFLFASSAAHAQINIPSIINVLADPSGTCTNPGVPLQYNTQLNHLSACQGASPGPYSWALVSGGGGGGSLILENNSVSQGSITNLNLLPGTNMSWTTSVTSGVGSVTPVISGLVTPVQVQDGQLLAVTTTSSSTTTFTGIMALNDPLNAYSAGAQYLWIQGTTACAGGTMTLNIDSLGAVPLKQADGITNLSAPQCLANATLQITYDATNSVFRLQTPILGAVVNPQTSTYAVTSADFANRNVISVASGTFTATLVANTSQPPTGQCVWFYNYGSGSVTIARNGQNINGSTGSIALGGGGIYPTWAQVCSDGTNYEAAYYNGTVTLALAAANLEGVTTNSIPYQTGLITTGYINPVNSAVLVTSSGGVPSESTAIPNGVTATTQSPGDNTTKLATDAFVIANATGGSGSITTLSDSATVTWAIGSASQAVASLTFTVHSGSRTLNITNPATAGFYTLRLVQDGTGGEGLTLGTGCTWKVSGGGSGAITPSTGAGAIDVISFYYDGTNCYANFNKNFN